MTLELRSVGRRMGVGTAILMLMLSGQVRYCHSPALMATALAQPVADQSAAKPMVIIHPFVFKADKKLTSVRVVGSFNNWNKTANPMTVDADGVTWRLNLPLSLGRHVY